MRVSAGYEKRRPENTEPQAPPEMLGKLGSQSVWLTSRKADIRLAQCLRQVAFGKIDPHSFINGAEQVHDADPFDAICDHVLAIEEKRSTVAEVVGTCRLLRQEVADRFGSFCSAEAFDLAPLLARHADLKFVEVGRFCVAPCHRGRRTAELIWHAIWQYALRHRIDVMIGCASLPGTDVDRLGVPLTFLHRLVAPCQDWSARARPSRYIPMDRLPRDTVLPHDAWRRVPPLLRGYLRLGAHVGEGAVIDHAFGTTDVLVILPVAAIRHRYIRHFGSTAKHFLLNTEAA
jgi:L-ornithine Nalpha-acyltransferase